MVKWKIEKFLRRFSFNYRYISKPPWDTGIPVPELVDFISKHKPGKALDLGCGTGTNMVALLNAGWNVDGVDFAMLAVNRARRKIRPFGKAANVYFRSVVDLGRISGKYDLIYDIGCYHALDKKEKASYRTNVKRLIRQNGYYLLYAFYQSPTMVYGLNAYEVNLFSEFMQKINQLESTDEKGRLAMFLEFRKGDSY